MAQAVTSSVSRHAAHNPVLPHAKVVGLSVLRRDERSKAPDGPHHSWAGRRHTIQALPSTILHVLLQKINLLLFFVDVFFACRYCYTCQVDGKV